MEFIPYALAFAGGYAASIYSWDWLKVKFVGVETAIRSLEDKIKALKAKL